MPAFALPSFSNGRVRINLVGRERHGVVEPEDYRAACDEVERQIRACHDARTGSSIAGTISRPRAHDPLDPAGVDADLVVEFEGWVDALNHPLAGCIGPFPFLRTSGHSPRGFALMAGPGVKPGDAGEHDATDLVPTLVSLLGHVPSEGLAGIPMRSVISHA